MHHKKNKLLSGSCQSSRTQPCVATASSSLQKLIAYLAHFNPHFLNLVLVTLRSLQCLNTGFSYLTAFGGLPSTTHTNSRIFSTHLTTSSIWPFSSNPATSSVVCQCVPCFYSQHSSCVPSLVSVVYVITGLIQIL